MPRKRHRSTSADIRFRNMLESSGLPSMAGRSRLGLKGARPVAESVTSNPSLAGDYAATITVAASDSTAAARASCDYVCDGTDDQEQFHLAFTDILARGGGRILLSEGTFQCSAGIVVAEDPGEGAAHVTLQGQGKGATTIASTFSSDDSVLVADGEDFHICDLTFDGSGVTGTSAYGVELFGAGCSVRRVRFLDVGWRTAEHSLYMASDTGQAVVEGCDFFRGLAGSGVEAIRLGGYDSIAQGNYFLDTPGAAVRCDPMTLQVVANNIASNVNRDASGTDAFIIGDYSIATGNVAQGFVATATISKGVGSVDANNVLT